MKSEIYLEKGEVIDLTLTVDQLRFHNYWLVKMKPDYEDGKFEYKLNSGF